MITTDQATRRRPVCDRDETGLPRLTTLGIGLIGAGTPVLGASLTVRAGETVALIGGPRSGKTAVLSVVAGLLTPSCGVVSICGEPLREPAAPQVRADCELPIRLVSTWDLLIASRHGMAPGVHGEMCSCAGVLVADEPSRGLPRAHRARVWRALDTARKAGQAVLVALRPDDASDAGYDRAYLLEDGRTRPARPLLEPVPA